MRLDLPVLFLSLALTSACDRHGDVVRSDGGAPVNTGADGGVMAVDAGCVASGTRATLNLPYATLSGVDASLLSLDVYGPDVPCAAAPVVVWVHGGAWATGDKGNSMADKLALFRAKGWVLVSVNYRLSPRTASLDPNRVMHPTHVNDVATALDWVFQNIAAYGGDPQRVALLGHSAGAHLVALTATDETFLAVRGHSLRDVRCVASMDTEGYDIPGTMQNASPMQADILHNAFGFDRAVWSAASPRLHVTAGKGIPPFILVRRGGADRQQTETAFHQALLAAGIASTLLDASSLTHEEVNAHIGLAGDTLITPPLMEFFSGCLP